MTQTLTTEQLRAVETTKEFRALLKYMRAIAKAEPESVKEKFELEEGLWRYASQKTIKAIVGHIDALEFALAANREAQPVAELVYSSAMPRFIGDTNEVEGYRCWIHGETRLVPTMEQAYADAKAVCTAPPAPAVPPEIPLTSPVAAEYVAGWNACRAAMLAQPVSSGYKLPDGWIACSERMPEFEDDYYLTYAGGVISVDCLIGMRFSDRYATHWMPLPAAPEGANG
ncbi:DUF551 domain-containing protein [Serratia marcescens]|nr:DUF551 domain-containing protein [Serratia marcescens]